MHYSDRSPMICPSPAELQSREKHVLCYSYDEKYSPGHMFKSLPHLLLLFEESDAEVTLPYKFLTDDVLADELKCLEVHE